MHTRARDFLKGKVGLVFGGPGACILLYSRASTTLHRVLAHCCTHQFKATFSQLLGCVIVGSLCHSCNVLVMKGVVLVDSTGQCKIDGKGTQSIIDKDDFVTLFLLVVV